MTPKITRIFALFRPCCKTDAARCWMATSSSGSPNDGRGADLAIFTGIWTHSSCRLLLKRVTIERFMLARVVAAAVVPRSAAVSPGTFVVGWRPPPFGRRHSVRGSPVPTANPKQLTDARESVDSSIDERSLQVDLVRLDRAVPLARCVGSRKPCTSASAQRPAAQMPEASGPQQHRPAAACWALSPGSRGPGSFENYKARDADALAPRWFSSLLALEIPTARWPAEDSGGDSPPHSRDECREPPLGRTADTRRTAQARHRCRTDHSCEIHGEEKATTVAGLEDLPSQSCRRHRIDGSVPDPDDLVSTVVRVPDLAAQSS